MIALAACCVVAMAASGLYLMLGRSRQRAVLGFLLLSNGVNLMVLMSTRLPPGASAPIVDLDAGPSADPLPQAFLLTAIVIGLGTAVFLLVMAVRAARQTGRDETEER